MLLAVWNIDRVSVVYVILAHSPVHMGWWRMGHMRLISISI